MGSCTVLWCLSRKSLEMKMSNVGGCPLGVVMQEYFLWNFYFLMVLFGEGGWFKKGGDCG